MPFNILLGTHSWFLQPEWVLLCPHLCLFLPGLPGRTWALPSVLCGFDGPCISSTLECVPEIQWGQIKGVPWSPLMSEVLQSGLPHLLSILSAKHNLCSTVCKIGLCLASQALKGCSEQTVLAVLVNAQRGLCEIILDARASPYMWMKACASLRQVLKGNFIGILEVYK